MKIKQGNVVLQTDQDFVKNGKIITESAEKLDLFSGILSGSKYLYCTYDDLGGNDLIDLDESDMLRVGSEYYFDSINSSSLVTKNLFDIESGMDKVTEALIEIINEDTGTPIIQATADGGLHWETVIPNTITIFSHPGSDLRISYVSGGVGKIKCYGVFYGIDKSVIASSNITTTDVSRRILASTTTQEVREVIGIHQLSGFRNKLINGDFRFCQYGLTQTTSGYGSVDRWYINGPNLGDFTVNRITDETTIHGYNFLQFSRLDNGMWFGQTIENLLPYIKGHGLTVSIKSLYSYKSTPVTIRCCVEAFFSNNDKTKYYTSDIVIQPGWNLDINRTIIIDRNEPIIYDGTMSGVVRLYFGESFDANATLRFGPIQLETGLTATYFEHRPDSIEFFLCERYFRKSYRSNDSPGTITNIGAYYSRSINNTVEDYVRFESMRSTPIIKFYSPITGAEGYMDTPIGDVSASSYLENEKGFRVNNNDIISTDGVCAYHWTASSEL